MPRLPGMRLPYVEDMFRAVGTLGSTNRGVYQYGGMRGADRHFLALGRRRMMAGMKYGGLGTGAVGLGGMAYHRRSSGVQGLNGRSSGGY